MKKKLGLFLFLLLVLMGCGSKKNGEKVNKIVKDSAIISISQDMDYLDPHKAVAAGTSEVFFNVFEGLLKPTSEGKLIPAVASDYSISKDSKTYTFTLRKGIKFHNGNLVKLDDIIYSYERIGGDFPATAGLKALSKEIKSIKKIGDNKIAITLNKADTTILSKFTLAIIPKDVEDIEKTPIGTGPFKFVKYLPGQSITMDKFDDYWNPELPKLNHVKFSIFLDAQSSILALQRGEIDLYPRLSSTQVDSLKSQMTVLVNSQNLVQLMAMNNDFKPFQDMRVRQAMAYAINSQEIIDTLDNGNGHIAKNPMSPVMKTYYNSKTEEVYPYNIEKAKELLVEAGYPNGFEFELSLPGNYQFHTDTGAIIAEQLKKIGVTAKLKELEWGTWLKDVYAGRKYDATVIAIDGKIEPFDVFSRYLSTSTTNFMNFKSEAFDKELGKIQTAKTEEEKLEIYNNAQMILAKELPGVYTMAPASNIALNNGLTGYLNYPIYVLDASTLYFKK